MPQTETNNILFLDIETVPLVYDYKQLNESFKKLWDLKWQYNKEITAEQQYAKERRLQEKGRQTLVGQ